MAPKFLKELYKSTLIKIIDLYFVSSFIRVVVNKNFIFLALKIAKRLTLDNIILINEADNKSLQILDKIKILTNLKKRDIIPTLELLDQYRKIKKISTHIICNYQNQRKKNRLQTYLCYLPTKNTSEIIFQIKDSFIIFNPNCHPTNPNTIIEEERLICIRLHKNKILTGSYFLISKQQNRQLEIMPHDHNMLLNKETAGIQQNLHSPIQHLNLYQLALPPLKEPLFIEKAILISGRASSNYFHFLFEYLTKFVALSQSKLSLSDKIFVIEDDLHFQQYEAFYTIFGESNILLYNKHHTPIQFGELFTIDTTAILPDHLEVQNNQDEIRFASNSTKKFRKILLDKLDIKNIKGTRKIFLDRKDYSRGITNYKQLKKLLLKFDFEFIKLEQLTFEEQARVCRESACIIGSAGSAFANMIFANKNTTLILFSASYHSQRATFSTIGHLFELNLEIMACAPMYKPLSGAEALFGKHYIFSPFTVDISNLEKKLKKIKIQ
jgi:hypothetical protein